MTTAAGLIGPWVEKSFHLLAETAARTWPQAHPGQEALDRSRLVAHRGAHGSGVVENTLAAFDLAADAGLWGIELDIRWTADLVPVVFHDANTYRLFKRSALIRHMTIGQLENAFPRIPRLETVIRRYGGRTHLMVETKAEPWPDPAAQDRTLAKLFSPLTPLKDYHILSLDPEMFDRIRFAPPEALLPVAERNVAALSRLALDRGWAGICGHFLLIGDSVLARHRDAGQQVGTGYIHSQNSLFRELRRNVTWLFTNQALAMQALVKRLKQKPDAGPSSQ